jgi:tRNA 2-thiouridine synthesizing protein A
MKLAEPILIDARGLACPHPVLALRAELKALAPGARVLLLATDPLAGTDVRAYCLRAGHQFLADEDAGDHRRFTIARGA